MDAKSVGPETEAPADRLHADSHGDEIAGAAQPQASHRRGGDQEHEQRYLSTSTSRIPERSQNNRVDVRTGNGLMTSG